MFNIFGGRPCKSGNGLVLMLTRAQNLIFKISDENTVKTEIVHNFCPKLQASIMALVTTIFFEFKKFNQKE